MELGRGFVDNLTKYIRFQMGGLFGCLTFLGASTFNLARGIVFFRCRGCG